MSWAVVPAAGRGARFGGDVPKQYLEIAGRTLIEHSLRALLSHPGIDAVMVALSPDDPYWAGWREMVGKPVYTCVGGTQRAESVLSAVQALPATVSEDQWVLVHDAARPCLRAMDLTRLIALGQADPVGAILAAPALGTGERAIKDVRIGAPAIAARLAGTPEPQPATPTASTTPSAAGERSRASGSRTSRRPLTETQRANLDAAANPPPVATATPTP